MHNRSFSQYQIPSQVYSSLPRSPTPHLTVPPPSPGDFASSLKQAEHEVSSLLSLFPQLSASLRSFKLSKIHSFILDVQLHLRSLDLQKQELVSKYEGKISYIEEELNENERKNFLLKDKVRVLTNQLTQMRDEYNQVNEDFNSTMQLLKEQMNSREKAMEDEEDKHYKLNHLIQVLKEELEAKDEELNGLKESIEKYKKKPENTEDPAILLEKIEKKYKSLEILYMQQVQNNNSLTDNLESHKDKVKSLEDKVKDLESQLKSQKPSKDSSLADVSQGSMSETDQSSSKVSWRFEATQLTSKVNELKQEISRLNKLNEDYKFEIIMLHNKVANLQIVKKPEAILEISEQLKSNDYDLTGTLEANELFKPEFLIPDKLEENYAELAKVVIVKNLVPTEKCSDYSILKETVETLAKVREVLSKFYDIKRERPDLAKDLENFIESKLEEKSYENRTGGSGIVENRTIEHRPLRIDDVEFQNYTEPSPRFTARTPSHHVTDLKEKLLSKKKIILLHKEQIVCLKKQLRETEAVLQTYAKMDLPMMKNLILNLFGIIPKQDDKVEKEIDICMNFLGFTQDQILSLKTSRNKKKFWLFG